MASGEGLLRFQEASVLVPSVLVRALVSRPEVFHGLLAKIANMGTANKSTDCQGVGAGGQAHVTFTPATENYDGQTKQCADCGSWQSARVPAV